MSARTTEKEYSLTSIHNNHDDRYAIVQNMVADIANDIRTQNPVLKDKETWWNENNRIFIHALQFGVIHSIQLLQTPDKIIEYITFTQFQEKYKNMDVFLGSFTNVNQHIQKIIVKMNLEKIVRGSAFDPGQVLGGRKSYTLKRNKNRKKSKSIKQTSSTRYRKHAQKKT
jgi:hypothetical protein